MEMQRTTVLKPAPLSIHADEYVPTPSSSTTVSPAESLVSVTKKLKPWERSSSVDSSVNSSDIEVLWEEDEYDAEPSVVTLNNGKTSALSLKMQTHLHGMQRRLDGLQQLMQEAEQQSRLRSCSQDTLGNASVVSAEATVDTSEKRSTAPPKQQTESVKRASTSRRDANEDLPNDEANDSRDDPQDSSFSSNDEDGTPAITTLLDRIEALQAQLKEATDENQQLQNTVHRLEDENARLIAQTEFNLQISNESTIGRCSQLSGSEKGDEESISRLTIAVFGEPSDFQQEMEEDLAILKNHERCQLKLHELWSTICTLRTFVETYELERNAMKVQRDDAIADADRADAENAKLASSSNPQQKIKYLQQVKKDNQALRRKNRALNVRIAQQAAKLIHEKNGCSLDSELSNDFSEDSFTLDESLLEDYNSPTVRTSEEILRNLRDHSGVLEDRLERLRLARQDLSELECNSNEEIPTKSAANIQRSPTKSVRRCCRDANCKDLRVK